MTLRTRIIPCLQLVNENLVKTVKFSKPAYIGDFSNTVRIFNELEVDELCFLSIRATLNNSTPNIRILSMIAEECFMPLSYGGAINEFETAKKIFKIGFEKIVINSCSFENPDFIRKLSEHFGSQSVIASIDVKKNIFGHYHVYSHSGTRKQKVPPVEWAQKMEEYGAGEILLTSINNDGTWLGYDLQITKSVTEKVSIPVIANGGAGKISDFRQAIEEGNASALGVGSMVVYQNKGLGVLVNFPKKQLLESLQQIDSI